MRGRDLLIAGIGLLLAGRGWGRKSPTGYGPGRDAH
jgi:hypothetical protein